MVQKRTKVCVVCGSPLSEIAVRRRRIACSRKHLEEYRRRYAAEWARKRAAEEREFSAVTDWMLEHLSYNPESFVYRDELYQAYTTDTQDVLSATAFSNMVRHRLNLLDDYPKDLPSQRNKFGAIWPCLQYTP